MLFDNILNKKVSSGVVDLLPLTRIENDCFVTKNNQYLDLFCIATKDLESASDDETNNDIHSWHKFFRTTGEDIKIISLNFPTNTKEQQRYIQHKLQGTKNRVYQYFLEEKLEQLQYIEKHRTNREFYLMAFFDTLEKHRDGINIFTRSVGGGGVITEMTTEKKIQILSKLTNKCTSIFN